MAFFIPIEWRQGMIDISSYSEEELETLKNENLNTFNESLFAFRDLLSLQYNITVARKEQIYSIKLVILERNFVHMAGIDKLSDIALVSNVPNIYKKIIAGDDISNKAKEQIASSIYFDEIITRLYSIIDLRDNFYNARDNKHYRFISKEYGNYTSIKYDFIIKSFYGNNTYYYFLRKDDKTDSNNQYIIVSTFIDNIKDYSCGQAYMTLLEKVEIDLKNNTENVIYRR